ncbi:hypothetical protein D3C86_1208050 [compost metagenome]
MLLSSRISPIRGFLKSSPINSTFFPAAANINARFTEVKDFPSPLKLEVILIILHLFSEEVTKERLVLNTRKASEIPDCG